MRGLRNCGIPLGGLGTGSVEIRNDGYFHQWQIMNNKPWGGGPRVDLPMDTSYFGIQVKGKKEQHSAILGLPPDYNPWLNDPYSMPWIEHPDSIHMDIKQPFTNLSYDFSSFPIEISMECFTPFIPLDVKSSGLPLAYFEFTVKNTTKDPIQISLFQTMRNIVGYSEKSSLSSMKFESKKDLSLIHYSREQIEETNSSNGTIAIGVLPVEGGETSYAAHILSNRDLWEPLRDKGQFENKDYGSFEGEIGNQGASRRARLRYGLSFGAICQTIELAPMCTQKMTFILTWHFPNMEEMAYEPKSKDVTCIGHQYACWFAHATQVAEYAAREKEDLKKRTQAYVNAYYQSTLPKWLLDAIYAQMTTLVKASWWDQQGRFGIWEGLGCCGLQTTDITHYGSFPILQFFPKIQKSQMQLTKDNIEKPGQIPHMMPGNFSCSDVDHKNRIDLIPQFVLLVWRDFLWTGDIDYAKDMWPTIKEALDHFMTLDTDGDGLPNNMGPDQTYDQFPLKGTSAFVGFLYAASLEAASQMAHYLGDVEYAQKTKEQLNHALHELDLQLWNGEYYSLSYDLATQERNEGVMADQINGDWFIRMTIGEGLLPDGKVQSVQENILKHCTAPRGYIANCAWPEGDGVKIGRHTADQANWPWTGVEYALASHLILVGKEEEGYQITKDVWERHERIGLRFNHIECGQHYYRALSSWCIYLALTGFSMNQLNQSLTMKAPDEDTFFVFNTPTSWGSFTVDIAEKLLGLRVHEGQLMLKELNIKGNIKRIQHIKNDEVTLEFSYEVVEDSIKIIFNKHVVLDQGQRLNIKYF